MGLDLRHVVRSYKTPEVEELDYFTKEELRHSPEFLSRNISFLVEKEVEGIETQVLYFKEKGYQRKGMSSRFYKDFQNDKPYFDLYTVKKAYQYLEADHISSLEELQWNFQKNFIENFVEGESIFFASW
jgi:hypothetical protein